MRCCKVSEFGPDKQKQITSPSFWLSNDGRRFLSSGLEHNVHMILHGHINISSDSHPLHGSAVVSSGCSIRERTCRVGFIGLAAADVAACHASG